MKKKILFSVMTIALAGALIGGGIYAYFSDVETSTGNVLTAGTLNLTCDIANSFTNPMGDGSVAETEGADGENDKIVFSNLAPGDSGTITWVMTNTGSLEGTLTVASTVTTSDVSQNEPELAATEQDYDSAADGDLDTFMGVTLQRGIGTNEAGAIANFVYVLDGETKTGLVGDAGKYVQLSELEAILDAESNVVQASGSSDTIVYKLSWQLLSDLESAGDDTTFGTSDTNEGDIDDNAIQSDNATLDISSWTLTQS